MINKDQGSCLQEQYSLMCSLADSTLEDMKDRICNGTVTLNEMDCVCAKEHQVMKLCAAANSINEFLELRKCECTAFKRHKSRLGSFCREVDTARLQIKGTFMHVWLVQGQ